MNFEIMDVSLPALIASLIEMFKYFGVIKDETSKFIPVISITMGLIFGIYFYGHEDIMIGIIKGLYLGLTPMGIYETLTMNE